MGGWCFFPCLDDLERIHVDRRWHCSGSHCIITSRTNWILSLVRNILAFSLNVLNVTCSKITYKNTLNIRKAYQTLPFYLLWSSDQTSSQTPGMFRTARCSTRQNCPGHTGDDAQSWHLLIAEMFLPNYDTGDPNHNYVVLAANTTQFVFVLETRQQHFFSHLKPNYLPRISTSKNYFFSILDSTHCHSCPA